jgi:histidyl-tRNA synthetase
MRDYLPNDTRRRRQLQRTIEAVFELYGFEPLETPAAERIETLLGKYGEEGDQLLFRILKRGEGAELGQCDMGLRYDLTVPLARVVALHQAKLALPFKRYQIQPVWRADRPQKGRFREFVQCDVDIVGTSSLAADAELVAVAHAALVSLGLADYTLGVNHRGALAALVSRFGAPPEAESSVLVALDKLDKVGPAGVEAELEQRGLTAEVRGNAAQFMAAFAAEPSRGLELLAEWVAGHEGGDRALSDLRELAQHIHSYDIPAGRWRIDPLLARGLSYYTGPVFEATLPGFSGSVLGGGRYDGLVGMFLGKSIPATGLSLGFERLCVILEERQALVASASSADVAVLPIEPSDRRHATQVAQQLRREGLRVWLPSDDAKPGKHLKAAVSRGIPLAVLLGAAEQERATAQVKHLSLQEQAELPQSDIAAWVKQRLA